VPVRH